MLRGEEREGGSSRSKSLKSDLVLHVEALPSSSEFLVKKTWSAHCIVYVSTYDTHPIFRKNLLGSRISPLGVEKELSRVDLQPLRAHAFPRPPSFFLPSSASLLPPARTPTQDDGSQVISSLPLRGWGRVRGGEDRGFLPSSCARRATEQ